MHVVFDETNPLTTKRNVDDNDDVGASLQEQVENLNLNNKQDP